MSLGLKVLGGLLALIIFRELIFRFFFIYPRTDATGTYAAFIEEKHIYRWQAPIVAGKTGRVDIFFAGNSHVMDGIDPEIISRKTGLRAYNLALYALPVQNLISLLFEYEHYPRLIFVDFSTRYSTYRPLESVTKQTEDALRMGVVKQRIYNLADRVQSVAPSLFVPSPFAALSRRAFAKILKLWRTGHMNFGRYTPFRHYSGYEWWLNKGTNHRMAKPVRAPSRWQTQYEAFLLEKCIKETPECCDFESQDYIDSLDQTELMVEKLQRKNVEVVFMRMPLHPKMITYENKHFDRFFSDIKGMADRFGIDYIDFNSPEHQAKIGKLDFYSDGLHLIQPSAVHLSEHLASLIKAKLEPVLTEGVS